MRVCAQSTGESGQKCGLGPTRAHPAGLRLWSLLWPRPGAFSKTVALGKPGKLMLSQSLIPSPSCPVPQSLNQVGGVSQGRTGLVRPWSKPWDYGQLTGNCPIPRERLTPLPPENSVPEPMVTCTAP